MRLGSVKRGPDEITTLSKSCILELRIGIDDEVVVTNGSEVSARGRESNVLHKRLTHAKLFHILWLHCLAVFAGIIGALEQLQVESGDLILLDPDDFAI